MPQQSRRHLLKWLTAAGAALAGSRVGADHTPTHFGDAAHKVVYQCNKADDDYLAAILFSVGELVRKYGDDAEIVVTAFGPGIHLLAKRPRRAIRPELQAHASSLALYGVAFHACGNTLKGLDWTEDDLLPFATTVPIGAEDLMLLQEQGYSYISW